MSTTVLHPEQNMWQKSLNEWLHLSRKDSQLGKPAEYIPALAKQNPEDLGITILCSDGTKLHAGQWEKSFTLQSISKVASFIVACQERGLEYCLERVDVEPTGDPFNSIFRLEVNQPGKPFNPMINAGAITICSLLPGKNVPAKLEGLLDFLEQLLGRRLTLNEEVFQSEWRTAYRNRAIANYLKAIGYLEGEVETGLEVYIRQCALEINTLDLAKIGLVLANDGYDPAQQKQLFSKEIARISKALMLTCGMYNASGKYAAFIGVPAKSGVSGGILAAIPTRHRGKKLPFHQGAGLGIYGSAIDSIGNSVAGTSLLKRVVDAWELSIF